MNFFSTSIELGFDLEVAFGSTLLKHSVITKVQWAGELDIEENQKASIGAFLFQNLGLLDVWHCLPYVEPMSKFMNSLKKYFLHLSLDS